MLGANGGGASMQSSSFTPASNGKTITIPLTDANISNLLIVATDFHDGDASAGWHVVGVVWSNNNAEAIMRYNNSNHSASKDTSVSISGTTLTCTANYNFITSKTYNWYAW